MAELEELNRVERVLLTIVPELSVPLSIDTYKAAVARRAIELGAVLVNDVRGLQHDPAMADNVAALGAAVVIVYNRLQTDERLDVIADSRRFYEQSLQIARRAGIPRSHIVIDPGIGFAKTSRQNREALLRLGELRDYGLPILVGLSRKHFLGSLAQERGMEGTLAGTLAANLGAVENGASVIRVHDVAAHVTGLKVYLAVRPTGLPQQF